MNHYMEHGKTTRFTLGTIIFIKTKFNYLECIKLKLDNFFHVTDDYVLSASLIKTNYNTNYILFDQSGRIQGITKPLFDFFMPKIMPHFNSYNQETV